MRQSRPRRRRAPSDAEPRAVPRSSTDDHNAARRASRTASPDRSARAPSVEAPGRARRTHRDSSSPDDARASADRRPRRRGRRGGQSRAEADSDAGVIVAPGADETVRNSADVAFAARPPQLPAFAPGEAGADSPADPQVWARLGLNAALVETLARVNFVTPSDIQRELIPVALSGRDVLGQAKTGTGKTAAFALPLLQMCRPGEGMQAIVLVPTRELATQVDGQFKLLGENSPVRSVVVLGGREIARQIQQLRQNPEIVIGTPGRVLDLMHRKALSIGGVRFAVLDEVDRMLDIGFRDDIRRILKSIAGPHQTLFVSATIDDEIRRLAKTFMREPAEVNVSRDVLTVEGVQQGYVSLDPHDKYQTLLNFLRSEKPTLAIVFTNTKHQARRLSEKLKKAGVNCKEIHGDLMQRRRERVMESFRKQHIQVLVATDLASRGLDVMEVSHIVNYDIPEDPAIYVHRIGRTARMGNTGYALTFVTREEGKQLTEVEKLINKEVPLIDGEWVVKREPSGEQAAAVAKKVEAESADDAGGPRRFREPSQRCDVLDSWGIKPVKRTLGSRFASPRKFRK